MASCDPFQYTGISSEVFKRITQELASKGFALAGPSGTVNGPFGIVIQYNWNEANQTLDIQVLEKNFFVSCSQIQDQLNSALAKFVK